MQRGNGRRLFVRFLFFKALPGWRALSAEEKGRAREEFCAVVEEFSDRVQVHPYSLVGTRADADFMLWQISPTLELLQDLASALNATLMARYLTTPYSYLAMTRRSPYLDREKALRPLGRRYLFVYPFTKTHEWYRLPHEARQEMMNEHFEFASKYPRVRTHTTYSFGLDDQEFVLGFEADSPDEFLDLVMDLRHARARPYTLRDTPIFTCIREPLRRCLEMLG